MTSKKSLAGESLKIRILTDQTPFVEDDAFSKCRPYMMVSPKLAPRDRMFDVHLLQSVKPPHIIIQLQLKFLLCLRYWESLSSQTHSSLRQSEWSFFLSKYEVQNNTLAAQQTTGKQRFHPSWKFFATANQASMNALKRVLLWQSAPVCIHYGVDKI